MGFSIIAKQGGVCTPEYVGYIYCITNRVTGKQYVGQTNTTVKRRYSEHVRCGKSAGHTTSLLYLAMKKYGVENFSVETLETVIADSGENLKIILNDREINYVKSLNTYKPHGYNMTAGGYAFADHVTRCVYKVSTSGDVVDLYESIAEAELQNKFPTGTIKRALSNTTHQANGWHWYYADNVDFTIGDNIGLQHTQQKRVYQFSINGELIREYASVAAAERLLGCTHGKISEVCSGKRTSAFGYLWSYSKTSPIYCDKRSVTSSKEVVQMTMSGEYISIFPSASVAGKQLNLQPSLISACCNGRRKSTGGYRWTFSMQ